jgi:type IV pilus assembly protein PilN
MIRINLLPVRQAKKREYGRQQLVLFFFLIVLEVVVLYMVYATNQEEFAILSDQVDTMRRELDNVNELEGRKTTLRAQLQRHRADRRVLEELQANRIGPGGVLEELKYIMSPPESERERAIQMDRGWDVNVDATSVWLEQLTITPSSFNLRGQAREGRDVAEFLLRIESHRPGDDPYFVSPELSEYSQSHDDYFDQGVMDFSISGSIRFHPMQIEVVQ